MVMVMDVDVDVDVDVEDVDVDVDVGSITLASGDPEGAVSPSPPREDRDPGDPEGAPSPCVIDVDSKLGCSKCRWAPSGCRKCLGEIADKISANFRDPDGEIIDFGFQEGDPLQVSDKEAGILQLFIDASSRFRDDKGMFHGLTIPAPQQPNQDADGSSASTQSTPGSYHSLVGLGVPVDEPQPSAFGPGKTPREDVLARLDRLESILHQFMHRMSLAEGGRGGA